MNVADWILTIGVIAAIPLYGLVEWVCDKISDRVVDHRHEVEELREKLEIAEDELDRWKEKAESTDKLLRAAVERADRLAAMGHGLAEDLAALKAYDPDKIEERLKKIQKIRAEEEKSALEDKLRQTIAWSMINSQLNVINQYRPPSPTLEQTIMAQQYRSMWR
jgi:DNA repair ATPase RecN